MQSWCVYVGTTVVLAKIDANVLTVANVGHGRCVLLRDGRAVRLTVDHKPDVRDEAQQIQVKGGFVKYGRIAGTIGVSGAQRRDVI
jgi:serine/threonine protein phosphatase PrpC